MTRPTLLVALILGSAALPAIADGRGALSNPAIDMREHLRVVTEAAAHRESRRVTEEEFLRMSREPGTIVLDARSKERYDELHVRGAVNLSFPDIAVASLNALVPDKETRILIYCNNNFRGNERAFASKIASASLNLSTYATLYGYGYRNVYELAPRIEIAESRLTFAGTMAEGPGRP